MRDDAYPDMPSEAEKLGLLEEQPISDLGSSGSSSDERESDDFDPKGYITTSVTPIFTTASALSSHVHPITLKRCFLQTMQFLKPAFFQGQRGRDLIRPAKVHPTAYLDGIRGLSALFVFFCHYFYQCFTVAEGWGSGGRHYHFLKLPIVRLWYQGPPAVCMFFVISGYALCYRPLKFIRSRSVADFSTTVSSLVFRRGIRLFLPTAISLSIISLMLQVGVYDWSRPIAQNKALIRHVSEPHPAPLPTFWAQFNHLMMTIFNFVHIFTWEQYGGSTTLDVHLWTIPVEFRCSLFLFLVLVGTARLQTKYRFLSVFGCMLFCFFNSRWELCLFYSGMIIAELDIIRGAHAGPLPGPFLEESAKWRLSLRSFRPTLLGFTVFASVYLMCMPDINPENTPGWTFLTSLIPRWWEGERYRFWQSIGAVVFIWSMGYCPSWQSFYNCDAVQYLGKISYALYLVHGPVLHVVGYHIEAFVWSFTGLEGAWYNAGFIIASLFIIPITIWAADVFWRGVDIPTVKFAKWMESKLILKT